MRIIESKKYKWRVGGLTVFVFLLGLFFSVPSASSQQSCSSVYCSSCFMTTGSDLIVRSQGYNYLASYSGAKDIFISIKTLPELQAFANNYPPGLTVNQVFDVIYYGNDNTGGEVPASQLKVNGVNLTLRTNSGSLVKSGETFQGWNTAPDGSGTTYAVGATYSANASVALYAKWSGSSFSCGDNVITPHGTYATVYNPTTFKCWFAWNLGGTRACLTADDTSCFGDLYQWGRPRDGHQLRTSSLTATLSNVDQPTHSDYITNMTSPYDWRSPANILFWQGVAGINNPCPSGWRVPNSTELNNERLSWGSNNATGAFGSPLKMPMAGYRYYDGTILYAGSCGSIWSSTISGSFSVGMSWCPSDANLVTDAGRSGGSAIRCIRN